MKLPKHPTMLRRMRDARVKELAQPSGCASSNARPARPTGRPVSPRLYVRAGPKGVGSPDHNTGDKAENAANEICHGIQAGHTEQRQCGKFRRDARERRRQAGDSRAKAQ
jgi:hypothetical protein